MKHYLAALPDWVLRLSLELNESLLDTVRKLREMADAHGHRFVSDGSPRSTKVSQRGLYKRPLGERQQGIRLRPPSSATGRGTWLTRLLNWQPPPYSFSLDPRDEGGARALSELQDRGISLVARAVAQSADHVSSFFSMLRTELAFYVGCVNLHEELVGKGEPPSSGES